MKIRYRLALTYTIATAAIFSILGATIYMISTSSRKQDFYDRLSERVRITNQLFLEKESLDSQVYNDIREKFLHTLPNEIEIVIDLVTQDKIVANGQAIELSEKVINEIKRKGYLQFEISEQQAVGKFYEHENHSSIVVVAATDQYGIAYSKQLKKLFFVGGIIGTLLSFAIGRLFAGQALKPIALKIRKAQNISAQNLTGRLTVYNEKDELGQLAIAFNDLLDRLQESFEAQKAFVRNASHEIRNPLTGIIGEAEVALSAASRSQDEYQESIIKMKDEAYRLNNLVNDFLVLTRSSSVNKESEMTLTRVDETVIEAKQSLDALIPENRVSLDMSKMPEDSRKLELIGHPQLLKSAILNLMMNACKFSSNAPVEVGISAYDQHIKLIVSDQGIGIPPEDLRHIFQPLFRSENARDFPGTGLGLSIVKRIVDLHSGNIRIHSGNMGTDVSINMPNILKKPAF